MTNDLDFVNWTPKPPHLFEACMRKVCPNCHEIETIEVKAEIKEEKNQLRFFCVNCDRVYKFTFKPTEIERIE